MYRHLERNRYLDLSPKCIKSNQVGESHCKHRLQGLCTYGAGKCQFQFYPIVLMKEVAKEQVVA